MYYQALSVDALEALSKTPQLADEICCLLDERLRAAIKQFNRAAKVLEARRRRVGTILDVARVPEINADQFERSDHWIAIGDVMLALPLGNRLRQWTVCTHAANLSAACGSVRS